MRPSCAQRATLMFAMGGAMIGLTHGCDSTGHMLNSIANVLPPDLVAEGVRGEILDVIKYGQEVHSTAQEFYDRILNAGVLAVPMSGIGFGVGKFLDVVSRVRTGYYRK